ncbi:MAG: UbiA-like polyprenyltransferase [Planctomycetota bacterium]
MWSALRVIAIDIKLAHTIFALPFAILSAFLAARGWPRAGTLLWILVAMVAARSSAMAFNRWLDHGIDSENPRTRGRALPAGRVRRAEVAAFTIVSAAIFLLAAAMLNRLCFWLSIPVLVVLLGYSATKRFTSGAHLVLGMALGLAPLGAWLAVTGRFDDRPELPILIGLAVLLWVAGFDILYSCQDHDFDRRRGLHSIPVRFGILRSIRIAASFHLLMVVLLIAVAFLSPLLGVGFAVGVSAVAVLLAYEHRLVWSGNLERLDVAFFNVNGAVSLVLMLAGILDVFRLG